MQLDELLSVYDLRAIIGLISKVLCFDVNPFITQIGDSIYIYCSWKAD